MGVAPIASATAIIAALIFAVAAASKLTSLRQFRQELSDYELLPAQTVAVAAIAIPVAELVGAIATLAPATRPYGALSLLALLVVFSGAVYINLRRGRRDISCACFGSESQILSWVLLFRNALLGMALLAGALFASPDDPFITGAGFVGALLAGSLGWLAVEEAQVIELTRGRSDGA